MFQERKERFPLFFSMYPLIFAFFLFLVSVPYHSCSGERKTHSGLSESKQGYRKEKRGNEKISYKEEEEKKKRYPDFRGKRRKVFVRAITLRRGEAWSTLRFPGQTFPLSKVVVSSKVSGKLKVVYVDVGDSVVKGELLAEINDEEFRIQLRRAESTLMSAQTSLAQAETNFKRTEKLFRKGVVPKVEFENAKMNYERAKALFEEAKASLELAKKMIEETKIRAPISGTVVEKKAEVGMVVSPQIPLFTIYGRKTIFVAEITEDEAKKLKKGMKTEISIPHNEGGSIPGVIQDVFFSEEKNSFVVRIEMEQKVPPGIFGVAIIRVKGGEGIFVPYEAVKISPEGENFVFVITQDGKLKKKHVRLLRRFGDKVMIDGVDEGTKIAAEITDIMFDGMEVEVIGDGVK